MNQNWKLRILLRRGVRMNAQLRFLFGRLGDPLVLGLLPSDTLDSTPKAAEGLDVLQKTNKIVTVWVVGYCELVRARTLRMELRQVNVVLNHSHFRVDADYLAPFLVNLDQIGRD